MSEHIAITSHHGSPSWVWAISLRILTGTQEIATPNKAAVCGVSVPDLLVENTCSSKEHSRIPYTCAAKMDIFTALVQLL